MLFINFIDVGCTTLINNLGAIYIYILYIFVVAVIV